ncbi:MAG: hypothetical protein EBU73_07300 [Chitinophagia bacterium]|nr:hypothetical protein [Chitinophagia bacterium]
MKKYMCTNCSKYDINYPQKHLDCSCPLVQYKYCSFCARNGHTTTECPYDEEIQYLPKISHHSITEFIIKHADDSLKNPKITPQMLKLWFNSFIGRHPCYKAILAQDAMKQISWERITDEWMEYCMPEILENIYGFPEEEYLEVVDHKVNIRAVLIAFGIKLSGIEEVNRRNVELLSERIGCQIRWIHFPRGESLVKVDEKPSRPKKQKGKKQSETPIDSEEEDYEIS